MQTAALDEMFHQGEASVQRYHKALLLMEGLSLLLTEQADILSISKCECLLPCGLLILHVLHVLNYCVFLFYFIFSLSLQVSSVLSVASLRYSQASVSRESTKSLTFLPDIP